MRIEVPGATSLVFTGPDGELLAHPGAHPTTRFIDGGPALFGTALVGTALVGTALVGTSP